MKKYAEMSQAALQQELAVLQAQYEEFTKKGLQLDISRGKPSVEQLELSMGMLRMDVYKDASGVDTRNYGQLEGTPEAREFFAQMLGTLPEEVIVGGNASLQMMYSAINLGWQFGYTDSKQPWKDCGKIKFLCPSPGYDRHFRVTEVFGFELVTVPMTPKGPDMDIVEELVKDEAVKGIWCIPIYTNPDGYTYSDEVVQRLAAMKTAASDFKIMWDNAYGVHHLTDEYETCLNIMDECKKHGTENRPLLFCSTSKMTFAGAGVGAMAASSANVKTMLEYLFPQMIGYDKVNQLRHVRFIEQEGGIEAHMKKQAALIAPKFKMVGQVLQENLGEYEIASWTEPKGGYFVSFYAMDGCAKRIVELCKQGGVVLTGAGAAYPYGKDPADCHIRIAPTFPPLDEVKTAMELLCVATRLASVEKLLQG